MTISNEIRIHDAIGNATSIGGTAIRLRLHPNFQPPSTGGFHLYDSSTKQLENASELQTSLR
jgi:hypothetical protein